MTSDRAKVILALTPLAERTIEHLLFGPDAIIDPCASIAEGDELDTTIPNAGDASAILLSASLSGLTAGHCAQARRAGLRLIGVALDDRDRASLEALAVDAIIDVDTADEELPSALHGEQAAAAAPESAPFVEPQPGRERRGGGSVLAVIGSKGAPGASECAASLAALAQSRWPTALAELDGLGGGLDIRLGAHADHGSVLALARAAQASTVAPGELLDRWLISVPGWPPVLLIADGDNVSLAELAEPGAVRAALDALADRYPLIVADVGFTLADGQPPSAIARLHRQAIACADVVLLVLGAREIQLRHGLAQLDTLQASLGIPTERMRIAVNATGAPGAIPRHRLDTTVVDELARRGLTVDAWLAWDQRALTRAQRHGAPLAFARPRGSYARALTRLLDDLFLPAAAPSAQTRKQRMSPPGTPPPADREDQQEVALPWQS